MRIHRLFALAVVPLLLGGMTRSLGAQEPAPEDQDSVVVPTYILNPLNVTATRSLKFIFNTAAPVSVVDADELDENRPNNVAEAIANLPGVDLNGVGANQQRPTIRGQRGQRILLLEDGLRLNNARRQSDFGELPAIVDVGALQRIEVVRGPASVLYGSDAIGGVVNMIRSGTPAYGMGDVFGGRASFTYRSEGEQIWPTVDLFGRSGRVGFRASASFRDTEDYRAPGGSFGDIDLANDVNVVGTGVRDRNLGFLVDVATGENSSVYAQVDHYDAEDAGFGFVANEDLGDEGGVGIDIRYPDQTVNRVKAGFRALDLGSPLADRFDISIARTDNERTFEFDVSIPFGAPGTGVFTNQQNFTDLETLGVRAEAAKLLGGRHLLTYGADWYHDDSENTDASETTVIPFPGAPPMVEESDTPNVPFASYDKVGLFAQTDFAISDRTAVIVGARWQHFSASPQPTPGLSDLPGDASESKVVVAANALFEVTPSLNLVASAGRGFRAPNLVELFFNGAAPEGNGFQLANPELGPETSWNIDTGLKYRSDRLALEGYYFRTWLRDGIRIAATGDSVGPFPTFQSVNVDRLTLQGVEMLAMVKPIPELTLGTTFTWLDGSDDDNSQNNPTSDTYSTRWTGSATYRPSSGRWWGQTEIRHNGEQQDADIVVGNPIGEVLPSFTVLNVRAGIELFDTGQASHSLVLGVENLTDELYAEFSNATFFRPAPGRTLRLTWTSRI